MDFDLLAATNRMEVAFTIVCHIGDNGIEYGLL